MDTSLFVRVLWRFRLIVALGLIFAALLAFMVAVRPQFNGASLHVAYRQSERWTSTSRIWVTQAGFPLGRTIYDQYIQTGKTPDAVPVSKFSDPSRFSGLATVFVPLVSGDGVRKIMLERGPIHGVVAASQPTLPGNSSIVLPFLDISASATNPRTAEALSRRATRALIVFLKDEQNANRISADKRVVLEQVLDAQPAVLTQPRSKSRPIIVFIATTLLVLGLVFLLENLRPGAGRVLTQAPLASAAPPSRRSA